MSNNQRVKIDIVLCGDVRVGKTSFVLRATGKKVSKKYIQTIGICIRHWHSCERKHSLHASLDYQSFH